MYVCVHMNMYIHVCSMYVYLCILYVMYVYICRVGIGGRLEGWGY